MLSLIRMAIVPAFKRILGRAKWWFPRWAEHSVPHVSVELQTYDRPVPADADM
jgi:uncharacterized membrane protein YdfJ with MMPL/SSD domain